MDNIPTQNVRFHFFDGKVEDAQISGKLSNYTTRQTKGSEAHHSFRLRKRNPSEDDTEHYDEMTWG